MKRETLKIKPDFIGTAFYEKLGTAPRTVDGVAGNFARHIVNNEKHGTFHVITPASSQVIPYDAEVRIIDPLFYPDRAVNGSNVAPAMNVLAKRIEIVKGGN